MNNRFPLTHEEMLNSTPPTVYDNTMRVSLRNCERKFYWWWRGYDYTAKPGFFTWGSAWGETLGAWYQSPGPNLEPGDPLKALYAKEALFVGLSFWDAKGAEDNRNDTRQNLATSWELYLNQYPVEPWQLVKGGAELGWMWPLDGTDCFLAGSMDGYLEWQPFGLLVLENKTVGVWLSDQVIRQYRFSPQVTGYIWYLTQLVGDECFGCIVNIACKQTAKSGTTPKFVRSLERRTKAELAEFEYDWRLSIEDFRRAWRRGWFAKTCNPIECTGGIGKSPCLYQPLCLSDIPLQMLDPLDFPGVGVRKEPWQPWKRGAGLPSRGWHEEPYYHRLERSL